MNEKSLNMQIGKKVSTIAYNEKKSGEQVKAEFGITDESPRQETYDRLYKYVEEHRYKAPRNNNKDEVKKVETKKVEDNTNKEKTFNITESFLIELALNTGNKKEWFKKVMTETITNLTNKKKEYETQLDALAIEINVIENQIKKLKEKFEIE